MPICASKIETVNSISISEPRFGILLLSFEEKTSFTNFVNSSLNDASCAFFDLKEVLDDEVLFLVIRSSMGFKYNVRMCNQVGVIDSDYYKRGVRPMIWIDLKNVERLKNVKTSKPYVKKYEKNESNLKN